MPLPTLRPAALLLALPFLQACAATAEAPGFDCLALGTETPVRDEAASARFAALSAPGPDAAAMTALAGRWTRQPPEFDPELGDPPFVASHDIDLTADGTLTYRSNACSPVGCDEAQGRGRWMAVATDQGTRLLVQRDRPEGGATCTELAYDPARADELREPTDGGIWARG